MRTSALTMLTTYHRNPAKCICSTWDRGSVWHVNSVEGHHRGCRILQFNKDSRARVEGLTPEQLNEKMEKAAPP